MVAAIKSPLIGMDIRVALTHAGINTFVRNKQKLTRFRGAEEYDVAGIRLSQFSADSIQKLIRSGMAESVYIPTVDVRRNRAEVIDLTKIISYGLLYIQFAHEVYQDLIRSPIAISWNRRNVRYAIENASRIPVSQLSAILGAKRPQVTQLQNDVLRKMQQIVMNDVLLAREEAGRRTWSAEKFVRTIDPMVWLLLLYYSGSEEAQLLEESILSKLGSYLKMTVFSDYLALLVVELTSYLQFSAGNEQNGSLVFKIRKKLDRQRDRAKLHIVLAGEKASFGTIWSQLMERSKQNQSDSLERFYAEACMDSSESLGLYYSSFLREACKELGVTFESFVNQPPNSPTALINLIVHIGNYRG